MQEEKIKGITRRNNSLSVLAGLSEYFSALLYLKRRNNERK
jgi:hypothetical protein